MIGSPDILQLLKGVDLFSALNEEELEQIASVTVKQKFCRDETIILEKDVSFQALSFVKYICGFVCVVRFLLSEYDIHQFVFVKHSCCTSFSEKSLIGCFLYLSSPKTGTRTKKTLFELSSNSAFSVFHQFISYFSFFPNREKCT